MVVMPSVSKKKLRAFHQEVVEARRISHGQHSNSVDGGASFTGGG